MRPVEKYVSEYIDGFDFTFSEHISKRVFDVEIEVDAFEYNDRHHRREKAHVVLKKNSLQYECDCCEDHDYNSDFYPVVMHGQRFICFRKTLYGFTLLNADTLAEEYEYFPENVILGEESFIIVDVKQLDEFLIFEGCYWACPYECFCFDYDRKLFWNVSKAYGIASVHQTALQDGSLVLLGTDENGTEKKTTVLKQDIIQGIKTNGTENI